MTHRLSIIVCTHNPRADYLARTLDGLRAQILPVCAWELLVIDNASHEPLAGRLALSWHPAARIVREDAVGLTAARLRGIDEAAAPVLLFVDDDNILAPDYLTEAARLADERPTLGAWGCGRFTPEWEEAPAPELAPLLVYLAVHAVSQDHTANRLYDYSATPAGAGLCVRAVVARHYAQQVRHDPRRMQLDRTGTGLAGCGDFDLAFTAIDLGLGTGVFTRFSLTHLMPRSRVQPDYLRRLVEGHGYSSLILHTLRGETPPAPRNLLARLRRWRYLRSLTPVNRTVQEALAAGEARACAELARLSVS